MFLTIVGVIALVLVFALAVAAMWFGAVHGDLNVTVSSSRKSRLSRN